MNKKLVTMVLALFVLLAGKVNAATLTQYVGDMYISQTVNEGQQVKMRFVNQPGYTFKKWIVESGNISIDTTSQSITFTMPDSDVTIRGNYTGEGIAGGEIENENIEPATLAANSTWYKGTTAKSKITQIDIVSNYIPAGTVNESWNADVDNTGLIKCYVEGTKLTIAGNGSNTIKANTDSKEFVRGFSSITNISGLTLLDTSDVTDMNFMFTGCSNLTSLDLSNFNTTNVTDMRCMFSDCSRLNNLNLSNFNTTNVTNMMQMFIRCSSLISLNLSNFDTSKVTYMDAMFSECNSLTNLNLSSFDTSKVINMGTMFWGCSNLTSLNLSNFDTSNVTKMTQMFENCSGLTSLNLSNFDTRKVTHMTSMFQGCSSLTSLNLSNFSTNAIVAMPQIFSDMHKLQEVTIGTTFSFLNSNNAIRCVLPTPSSEYISGADGNWYKADGTALTPNQVAVETRTEVTTYYAVWQGIYSCKCVSCNNEVDWEYSYCTTCKNAGCSDMDYGRCPECQKAVCVVGELTYCASCGYICSACCNCGSTTYKCACEECGSFVSTMGEYCSSCSGGVCEYCSGTQEYYCIVCRDDGAIDICPNSVCVSCHQPEGKCDQNCEWYQQKMQ